MSEESSFARRALAGMAVGGTATLGLSLIDASPAQRVGIPAAFGAFIAIALPDERDLGVAIALGAAGASGVVSAHEGRPALEFLPENLRPGNVRETFSQRGSDRRRRAAMLARADRLLGGG